MQHARSAAKRQVSHIHAGNDHHPIHRIEAEQALGGEAAQREGWLRDDEADHIARDRKEEVDAEIAQSFRNGIGAQVDSGKATRITM